MLILLTPTRLTCRLKIPLIKQTEGIQKLIGFSRGHHHWNSVRLGINQINNTEYVRLFNYCYIKGKRYELEIDGEWKAGQEVDIELIFDKYRCSAQVNNSKQTIYTNFKPFPIGYRLYGYFEEDGSNVGTRINVEVTNLKIR